MMMRSLTLLLVTLSSTCAFVPSTPTFTRSPTTTTLFNGNIEQIEFTIHPDGRVEQTVRGIKGGECHAVTEEINKQLGKVVDSRPTEEMYEEEIVLDQTISVNENNNNNNGWEGSSSW